MYHSILDLRVNFEFKINCGIINDEGYCIGGSVIPALFIFLYLFAYVARNHIRVNGLLLQTRWRPLQPATTTTTCESYNLAGNQSLPR